MLIPKVHFWDHVLLLWTFLHLSLTPRCRVLLEKLTGLQLVKKFPAFHGTRRFITALTSVRHLSLSWASPIKSIYPHPTSWRSVLISTHLRLGLPSGLLPSGFPQQDPIHPSLLTHMCHMPSPSHSSQFYHPHNIGWGVQIRAKKTYNSYCAGYILYPYVFSLDILLQISSLDFIEDKKCVHSNCSYLKQSDNIKYIIFFL